MGTVPGLADDDDDDVITRQLDVRLCLSGLTEIQFPEEESFFVEHGWIHGSWSTTTPEEQAAFLGPTTRFDLLVDGELQEEPVNTRRYNPDFDEQRTLYRTDFDDGMEDTVVFTGSWSLDSFFFGEAPGTSIIALQCDLTVHFIDDDEADDQSAAAAAGSRSTNPAPV